MSNIVTSRPEVIEELITRIKQSDSAASIAPGTPLYDLLVYHFADVITDERQLVNVATNIARVSPMFGDDGRLLPEYEDMAGYLTDRFFLTRPEATTVYDTLYLKFNRITGVNILAGSYVYAGQVKLNVVPTFITQDSPYWKTVAVDGRYVYTHPVNIDTASDVDTYIPASDQWITGGVRLSSGSKCLVLGAESKKAINTYVEPEVTFEYLRDSISNRSLSNPRSILYNLRNNLGFSPDRLKKARVMHTMEPCFIERRKVLFNDVTVRPDVQGSPSNGASSAGMFRTMSAIVSGDGKILLDYGTGLYTAPVDMISIDRADPLYSELNPLIEDTNPDRMITEINIQGVRTLTGWLELVSKPSDSDPGTVLYQVKAYVTALTETPEDPEHPENSEITLEGISDEVANVFPSFVRIWLYEPDAEEESDDTSKKAFGWVSAAVNPGTFSVEGYKSEQFSYHRDQFLLYRIDTRGLGLLSPVSTGSEEDMDRLKAVLASVDVNDLLPEGTMASVSMPSSTLTVYSGDALTCPVKKADFFMKLTGLSTGAGSQLSNNVLAVYSKPIYWKITGSSDEYARYLWISTDKTFKDRGLGVFNIFGTRPVVMTGDADWNYKLVIPSGINAGTSDNPVRFKLSDNAKIDISGTSEASAQRVRLEELAASIGGDVMIQAEFSDDAEFTFNAHNINLNIGMTFQIVTEKLINFTTQSNDTDSQYLTAPSSFVRNSNRYLVVAVNPDHQSPDSDLRATLLYYGTDPDLMARSQELYYNSRLAEIGNRIVVHPFRPVVFTAYWGPEYVTQYMPEGATVIGDPELQAEAQERYDTLRSQFIELQAFIESYMSDYQGKISDFDFADMVKQGQTATGLILKRLDWTVFTQRGYAVRGVLNINLDRTCKFDWTKLVKDVLAVQINDESVFVDAERETNVTDESLYRPLFSRVGI